MLLTPHSMLTHTNKKPMGLSTQMELVQFDGLNSYLWYFTIILPSDATVGFVIHLYMVFNL